MRCIDELDRVSWLLSTSLDVSEAMADALRLRKQPVDLQATLQAMVAMGRGVQHRARYRGLSVTRCALQSR